MTINTNVYHRIFKSSYLGNQLNIWQCKSIKINYDVSMIMQELRNLYSP